MIDECERLWKLAVLPSFYVLQRHLHEGNQEGKEKLPP
jgi:hypothetical protein